AVMRSKSVSQLSSIELIFKLGTDLVTDRELVQERLATVVPTLPTWAAPPVMMPPVSATSRIMKIGMTSKTQSLIDMSMTSYWSIRARLLRVPGVANVAIWGERLKMPQVQVEPDKMAADGARRQDPAHRRRGQGGRRPSAADRRRGHQRGPRPHARRREVPLGQHRADDPRDRGGAQRAAARPSRHRDEHHHLPAGDLR